VTLETGQVSPSKMRFAMRLRKANTSHVQSHIYEVGANQSHYLVKYRLWLFKQFQE